MTQTERYIKSLTNLKPGDLGLLRTHIGRKLDKSVDGFDLFAGLWWPLRQRSAGAPRRQVAWLIAKLYAFRPIAHCQGSELSLQLRRCEPREERVGKRFRLKFDEMLTLPLDKIEPALQWALGAIAANDLKLDWARMTNDLSIWERETTRLKWAKRYLETGERG